MSGTTHAVFVLGSYLAALAIGAGLILWVVLDGRQQRRLLAELESRGIRRRSASRNGDDINGA